MVSADNGIRHGQSLEALAKLKPVFERNTGTVTAGNSSQITDGAVALIVMTEERAESLGLTPLGRLVDSTFVGCDPRRMGMGPAVAIRALHERTGLAPVDADVIEINEAFAAQVIAVTKQLDRDQLSVPEEKLNRLGCSLGIDRAQTTKTNRWKACPRQSLYRRRSRRSYLVRNSINPEK